jgi:hypothetical protein
MYSDPGLPAKGAHLINDILAWWRAETFDTPIPVTIHIALIFGYLTWLIGYFSTWSLIKHRSPWLGVFLGTVVILVNLNFWSSQNHYFFLIYVIAALVLIAYTAFIKQHSQFSGGKILKGWGPKLWIAISLCFSFVAVFFSWTNPGYKKGAISDFTHANSPFKKDVELYWQNFFARVPGSGAPRLIHGDQQDLIFSGSLELSGQVVFIINTEHESYWRTQIYDFYESTGWKTSTTRDKTIEKGEMGTEAINPQNATLSYTLIPQVNTNVLPVTGAFNSGEITVIEKLLNKQIFTLNRNDNASDSILPADIASAAEQIRSYRYSRRQAEQQIESNLPDFLTLVSINRSGTSIQSITVARSQSSIDEKPILALSSAQALTAQQPVNLTVAVPPEVAPNQLETAGTNYPQIITDRYLQLPYSLPERVKELARATTQNAQTPYQKLQLLKTFCPIILIH